MVLRLPSDAHAVAGAGGCGLDEEIGLNFRRRNELSSRLLHRPAKALAVISQRHVDDRASGDLTLAQGGIALGHLVEWEFTSDDVLVADDAGRRQPDDLG